VEKLSRLVLALFVLLLSAASNATTVTVVDPVNGGAYTLDATLKSGTTSTYVVTLTVDLSAPNPLLNNGAYIEQVEFKLAGGNTSNNPYSNVSFMSGPGGATWTAFGGPLGANGCGGNNVGFVCLDASGGASTSGGLTIGSTKVFVWKTEVTLAPGVQLDPSWHIGVHYTQDDVQKVCTGTGRSRVCNNVTILGGKNAGIVSLSATPPIPEPASIGAFGLGALLIGTALRRRARA
jgi:hypothetical protein